MTPEQTILWFLSTEGNQRWHESAGTDFLMMSLGLNADGVREEYYPSWEDSDFIRVIIAVDGDYDDGIATITE